jgi:hypothetical protein
LGCSSFRNFFYNFVVPAIPSPSGYVIHAPFIIFSCFLLVRDAGLCFIQSGGICKLYASIFDRRTILHCLGEERHQQQTNQLFSSDNETPHMLAKYEKKVGKLKLSAFFRKNRKEFPLFYIKLDKPLKNVKTLSCLAVDFCRSFLNLFRGPVPLIERNIGLRYLNCIAGVPAINGVNSIVGASMLLLASTLLLTSILLLTSMLLLASMLLLTPTLYCSWR